MTIHLTRTMTRAHDNYPPGLTPHERDEILADAADLEAERRQDCDEGEHEPRRCPYCSGGRISVDGGSLGYTCPDCGGSGLVEPEEEEAKGNDEPDYDAPKPLTPLENWQQNDEHNVP